MWNKRETNYILNLIRKHILNWIILIKLISLSRSDCSSLAWVLTIWSNSWTRNGTLVCECTGIKNNLCSIFFGWETHDKWSSKILFSVDLQPFVVNFHWTVWSFVYYFTGWVFSTDLDVGVVNHATEGRFPV